MALPEWRVVAILCRKELRDAQRNRWFVLFAGAFAVLALALSYLGTAGLGQFGVTGFGRTAASLLQLVMLIVPLMGLILGALSITVERDHGTLLTLLAQPVTATEVFLGKLLGAALALTGALLGGFALSGVVVCRFAGGAQWGAYLGLVGFTLLLGLTALAVGFLLSSLAARTASAVGLALFAWLSLVFLSDLGIMGTAMVLRLSPESLLWLSLLNPVQVFKVGALQSLQGTLEVLGASGRYALTVLQGMILPITAGLLAGMAVALSALAGWLFQRRGAA